MGDRGNPCGTRIDDHDWAFELHMDDGSVESRCIRPGCSATRTKCGPQPKNDNGAEPGLGTWAIAALQFGCPDRLMWEHREEGWVDEHGCTRPWGDLDKPVIVDSVQS